MGRNYGLPDKDIEMFYSERDFKDGCTFNLWMGAGFGVGFTLAAELFFLWIKGIL